MPEFTGGKFVRTARDIQSHLNLGTLEALVADIMNLGALNDVEAEILTHVHAGSSALGVARQIKTDKFLSQGGFAGKPKLTKTTLAVCHKISFSAFDTALTRLMNMELDASISVATKDAAWDQFVSLLQLLYGAGYSYTAQTDAARLRGLVTSNGAAACALARQISIDFDACPDNLYFGYQDSNGYISSYADLHYDIGAAISNIGPAIATPRGGNLLQALRNLQSALGLGLSDTRTEIEYVGTALIKWTVTSGLDERLAIET